MINDIERRKLNKLLKNIEDLEISRLWYTNADTDSIYKDCSYKYKIDNILRLEKEISNLK